MEPGVILIADRNLPLYKALQFHNDGYHRYCEPRDAEPGSGCQCLSMSHAVSKALRMPRQRTVAWLACPWAGGTPVPVEAISNKMYPIESEFPISPDILKESSYQICLE